MIIEEGAPMRVYSGTNKEKSTAALKLANDEKKDTKS